VSVFQDLYDSEINFTISTFWDGGFDVKLGDNINGFTSEESFDRFGMIEPWLIEEACNHYPKSLFAGMYRDGKRVWLTDGLD
jgi:hypothetical protein